MAALLLPARQPPLLHSGEGRALPHLPVAALLLRRMERVPLCFAPERKSRRMRLPPRPARPSVTSSTSALPGEAVGGLLQARVLEAEALLAVIRDAALPVGALLLLAKVRREAAKAAKAVKAERADRDVAALPLRPGQEGDQGPLLEPDALMHGRPRKRSRRSLRRLASSLSRSSPWSTSCNRRWLVLPLTPWN